MKAKSIKGKSTREIKGALSECLSDGYKPTMAFVFLTDVDEIDPVSSVLDAEGITIFGASTVDKFTEAGIEPYDIVVLLLDINPDNFKIVLNDFQSDSVYDAACKVGMFGATTFKNPAFIITTADYKIPGEDIINGLLDKAGADVTVIGGMAGETKNFTGTVFSNHQRSSSGLIALILDEDKVDVKGIAVSGWKPVGTVKRITKSVGSWIYTIDHEPAMDVLKKFLGKEIVFTEKPEGIVPINDNYPLQVQLKSGNAVMRPTLLWNTADQSVMVGGPVAEGALFRFSLPPDLDVIDTVIESTREIKENELPDADAMIVFSCVGRQLSLGPMLPEELGGLAATWNTPMIGFFSLGEFGKLDDSRPEFHGTTVSWVALKEK
ncbi:MAG: FIST C-terminal domain-containing protein [Maribacter sp.]|nr:FIST C-terminal domain-containing protein [Maribacter sp.]